MQTLSACANCDRLETENARLRAYAKHERSLGAEGPMIELVSAKQEIERLRALVTDAINSLEFNGHPVDASAIRSQLRALEQRKE